MAFLTLLTKEMRLHLRNKYLFWLIVSYLSGLGLLNWLWLNNNPNYLMPGSTGLGTIGLQLYSLLVQVQLFLLVIITPLFTVQAINGEKEHQTFDLLLCSPLSMLSLLSGKLLAGLSIALILIMASLPLFSMIIFFGGITLFQIGSAFLIYLISIFFVSTLSLCCSTFFQRRATSIFVTYLILFLWLFFPLILNYLSHFMHIIHILKQNHNLIHFLLNSNPIVALTSTCPSIGSNQIFTSINHSLFAHNDMSSIAFLSWSVGGWVVYIIQISILTCGLFLLALFSNKIKKEPQLIQKLKHPTLSI